jgi:hypothetical protein
MAVMSAEEMQQALLAKLDAIGKRSDDAMLFEVERELAEQQKHLAAGEASLAKTRERIRDLKSKLGIWEKPVAKEA